MSKILVLVAHPDDETFSCGGTIARHIDEGDKVSAWVLTNNYRSPDIYDDFKNAMDILGVKECRLFDLKDSYLETIPVFELAQSIELNLKEEGLPDIVYTHYEHDLSTDHRRTFEAVITVFRPVWNKPIDIYSFETPSASEWASGDKPFVPNVFYDIRETLKRKIKAAKCYPTEIREFPHSRSVESLEARARYWGTWCGLRYAEPFKLIRSIRPSESYQAETEMSNAFWDKYREEILEEFRGK